MRPLLLWYCCLTAAASTGQESRYATLSVNASSVKIYLKEDEDYFRDLPPGVSEKMLGLYGLPNMPVKSELWIGDRELLKKQSQGIQLTQKEDSTCCRMVIIFTDAGLSNSDLLNIKHVALDSAKDDRHIADSQSLTLDRLKQSGSDVSSFDSKYIESAKKSAKNLRVVSESKRHCTFECQGPAFYVLLSYVLVEGRYLMIISWSEPGLENGAKARMAEVLDLVVSQTKEWDGVMPDFKGARFNGPDSLFSYKPADKWDMVKFREGASPFPAGVKYQLLRYSEKSKAGVCPIISFAVESANFSSLSEYWAASRKLMEPQLANGFYRELKEIRSCPASSGWPAITTSYRMNSDVPLNCRLVVIMIGPNQFLTATLLYDDTVSAEVIESGMECIESLDTPNSPKRKALR